uniref:AMP-dependent synthetase/ligase domain-containing protein n=1 Tax=Arcella intermedia TaxID=1963864 RepID=A0A6B2KXW9_9EUKA
MISDLGGVKTLYEAFLASVKKYPNKKYLGYRESSTSKYKWIDYKTAYKRALAIGCGLLKLGLISHKDHVGLFSVNRCEWILVEQACNAYSFCLVPFYDSLDFNAYSYIINQTELTTIICSPEKVPDLIKYSKFLPTLQTIIYFDSIPPSLLPEATAKNIKLCSFDEVENSGNHSRIEVSPPSPDEICSICYTSGTLGNPKGVLISHENLVSDVAGCFLHGIQCNPNDIHMSYLPLAHVFERLVSTAMTCTGSAIGFFRGNITELFDDILELKPTVFISVPQLWHKFYDKTMESIAAAGKIKATLFANGFEAKKSLLKMGMYNHVIWDNLIFNNIKQKLGGEVRIILTGSAPIPQYLMDFIRICFSVPVVEGYGQTETPAAATLTLLTETSSGHVGVPLPCLEMKLIDVPEMGYFVIDFPDARGEVCFRGPCVSKGYFDYHQPTDDVWDADGWYHTGDIGALDKNKNLRIIDRKKNIFKLLDGPFISPEKIENVYLSSKYIQQCYVYGDALKPSCVAIVVLSPSFSRILTGASPSSSSLSTPTSTNTHSPTTSPSLSPRFISIDTEPSLRTQELKGEDPGPPPEQGDTLPPKETAPPAQPTPDQFSLPPAQTNEATQPVAIPAVAIPAPHGPPGLPPFPSSLPKSRSTVYTKPTPPVPSPGPTLSAPLPLTKNPETTPKELSYETPIKFKQNHFLQFSNHQYSKFYKYYNHELKNIILEDMKNIGLSEGLSPWELVSDIWITPEVMTVQNGLLTPTLKIRRSFAKIFYDREIAELYKIQSINN